MEELNVTTNNTLMEVEESEACENSGNGVLGLAILGGVGAAVVGLLFATRKRRKARRIEKLRKEGYIVLDPEDAEEVVDAEEFDEE